MAEPRYTYYLEAYINTHANRYNLAAEMAMNERVALAKREEALLKFISDTQDEIASVNGSKGNDDQFRATLSVIALKQKVNATQQKLTIDQQDKVEREYTQLTPAVQTTVVAQSSEWANRMRQGLNPETEANAAADMVMASMSDKSEGQRLQAAEQFVAQMKNADARNQITPEALKSIAAAKLNVPAQQIGRSTTVKEIKKAGLAPVAKTLSSSDFAKLESLIPGAADPEKAATTQQAVDELKTSLTGARETLVEVREKMETPLAERTREIYQEQFSPQTMADRRMVRQYNRMNPDQQLIAGALSAQFKLPSGAQEDQTILQGKQMYLDALQRGRIDEGYNVYDELRVLLPDEKNQKAAIRLAIDEFEKTRPQPQPVPEDIKGAADRLERVMDKGAEFIKSLSPKERRDVRELRAIPGIQGEEEFPFSFAAPPSATIDEPVFERGVETQMGFLPESIPPTSAATGVGMAATPGISAEELPLLQDEEDTLLDILLSRYRTKKAMKGRAELPTYASGPEITK